MLDRTISAGRSAWYAATEPGRLARARAAAAHLRKNNSVAVCIPTFNRRELLLDRALPSVLRQTHPLVHVYVMAHGCTDGTADAVRRVYPGASNITVIDVPRTRAYPPTAENHWLVGPTQPLNAFLRLVPGMNVGWVARLDDDDVWVRGHLEGQLYFARELDYEFVSAATMLDGWNRPAPYQFPEGRVVIPLLGTPGLVGGCSTWVYRSYLSFFYYNPDAWRKRWNRNNDTDLPARMVRAGVRTGYSDYISSLTDRRPGEEHIGSRAYLNDPAGIEARYAFRA